MPAGRGGSRNRLSVFAEFDNPAVSTTIREGECLKAKSGIALDASREGSLEVVAALLAEVSAIFPDSYFHVGADGENDF